MRNDELAELRDSLDTEYQTTIRALAEGKQVPKEQITRCMSYRGVDAFDKNLATAKSKLEGSVIQSRCNVLRAEMDKINKECKTLSDKMKALEQRQREELRPYQDELRQLGFESGRLGWEYGQLQRQLTAVMRKQVATPPSEENHVATLPYNLDDAILCS